MIFSTVFGPHEPALTVGSLAITRDRPAADVADAGDDAVGAEPVLVPVGEQRLLGERALVEQQRDALADGQLALLGGLLAMARRAAGERALARLADAFAPGRPAGPARSSTALLTRPGSRPAPRPSSRRSPSRLRPNQPALSILRSVGGCAKRRSRNSSQSTSQIEPSVSSPTKSASVSGPIGCPAPAFIASSISLIEPTPSS